MKKQEDTYKQDTLQLLQEFLLCADKLVKTGGGEPTGFESLSMSISGARTPGVSCVTDSLDGIASSLSDVAAAIRELSEAVSSK